MAIYQINYDDGKEGRIDHIEAENEQRAKAIFLERIEGDIHIKEVSLEQAIAEAIAIEMENI